MEKKNIEKSSKQSLSNLLPSQKSYYIHPNLDSFFLIIQII